MQTLGISKQSLQLGLTNSVCTIGQWFSKDGLFVSYLHKLIKDTGAAGQRLHWHSCFTSHKVIRLFSREYKYYKAKMRIQVKMHMVYSCDRLTLILTIYLIVKSTFAVLISIMFMIAFLCKSQIKDNLQMCASTLTNVVAHKSKGTC